MLSNKENYRLHIHYPGDEFWLYLDGFPTHMATYSLPVKNEPTIAYIDVRLKDTVIKSKNTFQRPCLESATAVSYADCVKSRVITTLVEEKSLHCATWITEILHNWSLPECKTYQDFHEVFYKVEKLFYANLASNDISGCYTPCTQTVYGATLNFGNESTNNSITVTFIFV